MERTGWVSLFVFTRSHIHTTKHGWKNSPDGASRSENLVYSIDRERVVKFHREIHLRFAVVAARGGGGGDDAAGLLPSRDLTTSGRARARLPEEKATRTRRLLKKEGEREGDFH